jgi:hypothetical protein
MLPYGPGTTGVGIVWTYGGSPPTPQYYTYQTHKSFIASESHNLRLLGKGNVGGAFKLSKYTRNSSSILLPLQYSPDQYGWYGGKFVGSTSGSTHSANMTQSTTSSVINTLETASRSLGASAIARVNPMKPHSDVLTPVLELLKDGRPKMVGASLWKDQTNLARSAGKDYLNYEFGWAPLVRDIRDFAKTVSQVNELVQSFERQSGRRLRRRVSMGTSSSIGVPTERTGGTFPISVMFQNGYNHTSSYTRGRTWFSGAFKYYLPESGLGRYTTLAQKLFGVKLTPELLWNLAPWTWAVDWFANVGDILENISYLGSDACVLEWGYMMNSRDIVTVSNTTTFGGVGANGKPYHSGVRAGEKYTFSTVETTSFKTRVPSTAYSFSATPAPLTGKQQAIIAALGLSKIR